MATMDPRDKAKAERAAMDKAINSIAKKEFMEYTRRPWILVLAGLFMLLMLVASYALSSPAVTQQGVVVPGFVRTIGAVQSIVTLLIPIMAIILAHSSLAGEQESGSLGLLLGQPVRRAEIVLGKFVGLFGVLAAAIIIGFVLSAVAILIRGGDPQWSDFLRFVIATLLFTGAYFAVFFMVSALVARRTQALLYSIGAWILMGFVYPLIITLLVLRISPDSLATGGPSWAAWAELVTIPSLYSGLMYASSSALKALAGDLGLGGSLLDGRWASAALTGGLLAWIVAALVVARYALQRKDV